MSLAEQQIEVKWLEHQQYHLQINAFRYAIYVNEQGLEQDCISHKHDYHGLHLAGLVNNEIVSIISGFFIEPAEDELGVVLRFAMRMEQKHIRGSGLSELLCVHMGMSTYEIIRPTRTFVELFPRHHGLAQHYIDWGFHGSLKPKSGQRLIQLNCEGQEQLTDQYKLNKQKLALARQTFPQVKLPSLVEHLRACGKSELIKTQST